MLISPENTLIEIAVMISQSLEAAGITATLSGGAAVTLYSMNEYLSYDLDFVSSASHDLIQQAIGPLGFVRSGNTRKYIHPDTEYYVEFPPGPLSFGEMVLDHNHAILLETEYGTLRVLTPTQSVMDRLAAYMYWNDRPSLRQAELIAQSQIINWDELYQWASREGLDTEIIQRIYNKHE